MEGTGLLWPEPGSLEPCNVREIRLMRLPIKNEIIAGSGEFQCIGKSEWKSDLFSWLLALPIFPETSFPFQVENKIAMHGSITVLFLSTLNLGIGTKWSAIRSQ